MYWPYAASTEVGIYKKKKDLGEILRKERKHALIKKKSKKPRSRPSFKI